jgi:hypothetical protein
MSAVVIYESMFGNTRQIADAIAEGLGADQQVTVRNVNDVSPGWCEGNELMVIGGPTHVHGMSRVATRAQARSWALQPERNLALEPGAPGRGMRDWIADPITVLSSHFAAFASRADGPVLLSGNAAVQLDRAARRRGSSRLARPESFRVTKANTTCAGEVPRAREWGRRLAAEAVANGVGRRAAPSPGS